MNSYENVLIFEDTLKLCKENQRLVESIKKSIEGQLFIPEGQEIKAASNFTTPLKTIISSKCTMEAAAHYKGKKVCILNFASATHPGGGIWEGSNSQEETICCASTLYPCLSEKKTNDAFYTQHRRLKSLGRMNSYYNDDCIFTPNVTVFKNYLPTHDLLSEEDWFDVDVVTCAAPNLFYRNIDDDALLALHEKRANKIVDVASLSKADVLILGAFGCGSFDNPPEIVAKAMKKAVQNHLYSFEIVEFALNNANDKKNFSAFEKEFSC